MILESLSLPEIMILESLSLSVIPTSTTDMCS